MFCCSSHEQAEWRTAAAAGVGAAASPADADPDYPLVALSFSGNTGLSHFDAPRRKKTIPVARLRLDHKLTTRVSKTLCFQNVAAAAAVVSLTKV